MLKNRSLRLAALLAVFPGLAPSALAAAETPQTNVPYVFETVDNYLISTANRVEVTGILQGENSPRSLTFTFTTSDTNGAVQHLSRCDRMALLAMSKPGLYLFEMVQLPSLTAPRCRLTRR